MGQNEYLRAQGKIIFFARNITVVLFYLSTSVGIEPLGITIIETISGLHHSQFRGPRSFLEAKESPQKVQFFLRVTYSKLCMTYNLPNNYCAKVIFTQTGMQFVFIIANSS